MEIPDWACNKEKYYRAIGIVGVEGTEEALKDEYRKMKGLVKGEVETTEEAPAAPKKTVKSKAPAKKKK